MKIINFSEANNDLKAILDAVCDYDKIMTIERPKADDAVIMSLKHYDSLMETLYLLKSPANVAHLAKSIAQYRSSDRIRN